MNDKTPKDDILDEFSEMQTRYEDFIAPLIPQVRNIKTNVFYHIQNEIRTKEKLVSMARGTRPFLAKEIWNLLDDYMDFLKKLPGTEGKNYASIYKNFSKANFVRRLLFKRPIVFYLSYDYYMMRHIDGTKISSNNAHKIANNLDENPYSLPFLREYISYDENLLSSLIGMSTPTFYFNIGCGRSEYRVPHIDEGILCGLVGARNEKKNFMEHRFVVPREDNATVDCHKTDKFWIDNVYTAAFPQGKVPTYKDIKDYPEIYDEIYINGINEVYLEKRLMLSILPYMMEAAARGQEKNMDAFCSVPPIGGGVWSCDVSYITIHQLIVKGILKYLDDHFEWEKIKWLKALALPPIDIKFYKSFKAKGYIKEIKVNDDDTVTLYFKAQAEYRIKIFNKMRYVAELLPEEFEKCISVAGYAWDGNSYPGNEYWIGQMGSFDPQAIYCSLLGQFQNPEVNIKMADEDRIKIY